MNGLVDVAALVDVAPSGAVLLGPSVSCDGFHRDYPIRIQTHIHDDHMDDFETSKGEQQIYMSEATRKLLIADFYTDLDLPLRSNIHAVAWHAEFEVEGCRVMLLHSGHMLGSAQVSVELPTGERIGYSGDFGWPLQDVIKVDCLVVDSTYGAPNRSRDYTQDNAESALRDLTGSLLQHGPVYITAHRGTLQRGLEVLTGEFDCSFLGSERLCREVAVYREFGYGIAEVVDVSSDEGREMMEGERFIRFFGTRDRVPVEIIQGANITLSAYMGRSDDPVTPWSERSFSVALTDHADFAGTLAYVEATGAEYVVTDNRRGGHGVDLARELTAELNLRARPSSTEDTREWGL